MKFVLPMTNSSNFYGMVVYSSSASRLPLNEIAWMSGLLVGIRKNLVAKTYHSLSSFCLCEKKEVPSPRLIRSFGEFSYGLFSPADVMYAGNDTFVLPVDALPFLSDFEWSAGDCIQGIDTMNEEWMVRLDNMCGGVGGLLILSDHRTYNWDAFIDHLASLIPVPSELHDAVQVWRQTNTWSIHMFFGDVLLIDNFCLWRIDDSTICGISPAERQGTEEEDEESICYGARLLLHWSKENMPLRWSDIGGRDVLV